jgi:hypothetical protein
VTWVLLLGLILVVLGWLAGLTWLVGRLSARW